MLCSPNLLSWLAENLPASTPGRSDVVVILFCGFLGPIRAEICWFLCIDMKNVHLSPPLTHTLMLMPRQIPIKVIPILMNQP